ncbi:MAG: hypothetical protein KatS3mg043_0064 [Rhodothermaceae bacterium]|nr:MAG: hypothetical protein KatS3mg043_0064 [Rhodothermaceae bacterium]
MTAQRTSVLRAIGLGMILGLAACNGRPAYVVSRFEPVQASWDTLRVSLAFGVRGPFGRLRPAVPDTTTIYVFDAGFDTLYAGSDPVIPIPDAELGHAERLLVEACGDFGRWRVCEQHALRASPKRVRVRHEIAFPEDEAYQEGSYAFDFVVERQRFGAEEWEQINRRAPVDGFLTAYVASGDPVPVRIPFTRNRGRFNLARSERYRDFRYALQSQLFEGREAAVRFDIYARLMGGEAPVASVEKRIVKKSEDERMAEVGHFVEQAAGEVLARLGLDATRRRVYAFVESWTYDPARRRYTVEVSIQWRRGWLRGWDELEGRLVVREDGSEAVFEPHGRAGEDVIVLDSLQVRAAPPRGRDVEAGPPRRLKTW